MRALPRSSPTLPLILIGLIGLASQNASVAQSARDPEGPFGALVRTDERLHPREALVPLADVRSNLGANVEGAWNRFLLDPGDWDAFVDARNGRIESAEGTGIPWIPGAGNRLSNEDLGALLNGKAEADLAVLETIARKFVAEHEALYGVQDHELRLAAGRSGKASDSLWLVDFDIVRGDLIVEGARIVLRIGHGNLIQMGSELLPSAEAVTPEVKVTREAAFAALAAYVGDLDPRTDTFLDRGSLHLLPVGLPEGFEFAKGYGLAAVWEISFRREGVLGTWRGRIDATTGEVVEFMDTNLDAQATGGVAADSAAGTETLRALPFADLGGGLFTNSAGIFNYTGVPRTSTLNGQFVAIADTCGPISLTTNAAGNLPFGSAAGNNCTTPGVGGAGNTRSSRTSFYHVNRGKEIARGWLPSNAWLNGQLTAVVNNTGTCNGFWDGSAIQLYRAVSGNCGASGEEPGFILHEYGHGLDENDGNGFNSSSSEAYADVVAALTLHNSCVGPGFRLGNCNAYGDSCTSCTGLRDIDWAKHVSGTPHTVANFTQPFCQLGFSGPCAREPHCEGHVPAEAVWDFANRDLPGPGGGAAWNVLERLWYLSRSTSGNAFTCMLTSPLTSNGCNVGSWWKTMRAVDDDDGNLANGTPHSCNLFAAFDRHGIACTTDAGANTCFRGCAQPAVPAVTLTGGDNLAGLSWTSSGAGRIYDVYRNEMGCNAGFAKIADNVAGTTFSDNSVANGTTYFYQVVAHPSGNEACHAAPSTCASVVPGATKDAQFLNLFVPTSMVPGRQYLVNVTVKNTGGTTWNPIGPQCNAYRLAQIGSLAWNPTRAELPAPVAPGDQTTLTFGVIAPSPGTYSFQLRMVHECVEFFGSSSPNVTVRVGTKQAQIVAQTVPPVMAAGQPYSASVTIKNTGSLTWSPIGPQCDAYRLAQIGNPIWSPARVELPATLAAGAQVTLPINGIAPSTPGTYNFQVKMVHECVEFFDDPSTNVAVSVQACVPDATTLCFQGNRFQARVTWRNLSNGQTGTGNAVPYSNEGGFFWFASPTNLEVGVKVLDGLASNGKYWVFHGSLTDLEYTLTVTDKLNGAVKTYVKPSGSFCGAGDTGAFNPLVAGGAPTLAPPLAIAFEAEPAASVTPNFTCAPNATTLCLLGDRFQVRVRRSGVLQQGAEITSQAGSFWFFSSTNPEVAVKVIDGTPVNGKFWVFFGSLTSQAYQVEVVDSVTSVTKTFNSPAPSCGLADTAAF
jgi:hypothetical protein